MPIDKEFVLEYKRIQALAKKYKDKENAMRVELADNLLKHRRAGTHHFDFDNAHVKGVKKFNVTPDEDSVNAMWDKMSEQERACFKWKPSFLSSEFKKLEDTSLVAQCIVTKPAMPTFVITIDEDEE